MSRKTEPTYKTEQDIFPTRLRKIMQQRGTKQKELAAAIGMRPQTVSLYTTGQSAPDVNTLKAIAEFFNISADWLLGLSGSQETPDTFPAVKGMVQQYAAELDALALAAKSKGVYETMFFGQVELFPECIVDSWKPTIKRCQWILDHLDAFKDEDSYDGDEILRILQGK